MVSASRRIELYIQHVGLLRIFQHRAIPDDAKIKMVILKRDKLGNWYASLQLELPDPEPADIMGPDVGMDMGLSSFATLSTGEQVDNPRWFRASEEKLAVLQRHRARCQRGSRPYRELTRQIRRWHEHIANQRRDFHHQVSTELVRRFGFIALEQLNLSGLCRSHVSKSMGDAGWGYLRCCLTKPRMLVRQWSRLIPTTRPRTALGVAVWLKSPSPNVCMFVLIAVLCSTEITTPL